MKRVIIILMAVITMPALADINQSKVAICAACHNLDGNSVMPLWPKLAGQSASYIIKQLEDFKSDHRSNETMSPMVKAINGQDIKDLAAYFSTQIVTPNVSTQPELLATGKQIYLQGNIKKQVLACTGCHGANGTGNSDLLQSIQAVTSIEAPAIGSQHAAYLEKQLQDFKAGTRHNDVAKIMRNIAKGMTEAEMKAVAEYISSLSRKENL